MARMTVPMAVVIIIKGNPTLNHLLKLIGWPFFSLIPAATTPALDPMSVPLPPKSAPKASAHQRGLTAKAPNTEAIFGLRLSVSIKGIIVAVKGMLSTNALVKAESHTIIRNVSQGSPPVILIAAFESISIVPECSAAPTIMKRPVKNSRVGQSTSRDTF
jgi:hypothetical protein